MVRIPRMDRVAVGASAIGWAWLTAASAWAQAAPGGLPADAARTDLIPTKNMFDMLLAGGPMSVPIVLASFVMLLVVFERAISLRRRRVVPRLFVERFLLQIREGALDRNDALERCERESSHIARVFAAALRKWGKPAVEVEQAVLDEGERTGNVLRRYLRVINGVATVCPLFGLLGTVWGMMEAFNVIATSSAMGRAELLAGGISGALVSTAAGLFVAIPALIFYLYFVGRVDRLVMDIDAYGQELVGLISAEGLEERKIGRSAIHRRKAA
jgi:biopolymer transport protein ExbB